jgi:nucleotide-binding universal stress UspA family protein
VIDAAPWEAILAAARRNKCEAIVMASHGRRGVSALLLGSERTKLHHLAECARGPIFAAKMLRYINTRQVIK